MKNEFFMVESQTVDGNGGIVSFENFDLGGMQQKYESAAVDCIQMSFIRRHTVNAVLCRI